MIPDLIPILSVVACSYWGKTTVYNGARLRMKESDRIKSTVGVLRALGADAEELPEGMVIRGGKRLSGGTVDPGNDHRIAMSAAVAAFIADGPVIVTDSECVEKSYVSFWDDLNSLSMDN